MSAPLLDDAASRNFDESFAKLLVSAEELATILGVSQRTVWRLLSAGKLIHPVRIGGSVRWRIKAVQVWIDSGCPATGRWEG